MMNESKSKRVVVTGMGAICGLGHDLNTVWNKLLKGESGISRIENIDTEKLPVNIAGEIKNFELSHDLIPEREQKRYDRFIHLAVHAANEAIKMAGWSPLNLPYDPQDIGCILGVGMGGFPFIEQTDRVFLDRGARRVTPFFIPAVIPNMATGLISLVFGLKGINYSISSACASSAHAISTAVNEILSGRCKAVVTGGSEAVICDLPISGFASMKALSKQLETPQQASQPFNSDRDGFVIGEGAGVITLEDYDHAIARGATIYGEIVGHGATADAHHITAPHPEGEGAISCMQQALKSAQIKPEDIGYINAHGTSTPLGDIAETKAIKKAFGDHAKNLFISSTKSMTGHLLGAAGGLETIFCIKALYEGILPPTINLHSPDPECDLNYIPNQALENNQINYALNNSFGFGGTNSCLIIKKYTK